MMPEGLYAQATVRWPHMFATLSPTYMGIAQAAYDFTVQYLRGEVPLSTSPAPPISGACTPPSRLRWLK